MIGFSFFMDGQRIWWVEAAIYLGLLILLNFILKRILRKVTKRFSEEQWKGRIYSIFYLPTALFLWICGICIIISSVAAHFQFPLLYKYDYAFFQTATIFFLAWVFLRWKKEVEKDVISSEQEAKKIDRSHIHMISRLVSIVVIFLFFLVVLQIWGLDIVPLLAFGGVGAAALGFAAKEVIANFFGGIMICINCPFKLGDYISLPDRNLEGNIDEIGWYLTVIRDKDKRLAYVPNAIFSTLFVVNVSKMSHRRIQITVGIRKEDFAKLEELIQLLKVKLEEHPTIEASLPINVVFSSFGPYTLELLIDVYTKQTRYSKYLVVKQEILCLLYKTIQEMGLQVPNPTMAIQKSD